MSERQNVFAASPKRRYFDGDHLQPIVEVLTKVLLANHLSEISICRGNDSHIHRPIVCPANAAYLVILKNTEKLYLYRAWYLADLVEQKRPSCLRLQTSLVFSVRAGERTL